MDDVNWQKVFAQYSYFVEFYTEDKTYVAKCMEFPTLTITGKSREESIRNLQKFLVPELQNFKAKNGDFHPAHALPLSRATAMASATTAVKPASPAQTAMAGAIGSSNTMVVVLLLAASIAPTPSRQAISAIIAAKTTSQSASSAA